MRHLLLSPLTWAMVAGALLPLRRLARWRAALVLALLGCATLAAPMGANALVWLLEEQVPNAPACTAGSDAPLLLLAGGLLRGAHAEDDFAALAPASVQRLAVALALAQQQPGLPVIISGGAGQPWPEARLLAHLATRLGLAPSRVVLEGKSANTWDSAKAVASLRAPGVDAVQLVTSDLHSARATQALRHHGVAVCRHRADTAYTPYSGPGHWVPQSSALAKAERCLHELAGLATYSLRARFSPSGVGESVRPSGASGPRG